MKNIKYISQRNVTPNIGLGSFLNAVAIKFTNEGNFILCLVEENNPYAPIGGRKTLKNIVENTVEGECYHWRRTLRKWK